MPVYEYKCPEHGLQEVEKPMLLAGYPETCQVGFCPLEMKRVYSGQAFIMRPDGWSLRPGDRGYWNFSRQQELHQLRDGEAGDQKRLDASLFEREPPPKLEIPYERMRDIRNLSEIVDREIRASSDIPEFIREGS